MEKQNKFLQNGSLPSSSTRNEHNCASFSLTDPCIQSRNKHHLELLAKKINSKDIFSTFPTRIDPSIQFSDDDDDDELSTVAEEKRRVVLDNNDFDKENKKEIPLGIMKTPELSSTSRVKLQPNESLRSDILMKSLQRVPQSESEVKKYRKNVSCEFPRTNLNPLFQPFLQPEDGIIAQNSFDINRPIKNAHAEDGIIVKKNSFDINRPIENAHAEDGIIIKKNSLDINWPIKNVHAKDATLIKKNSFDINRSSEHVHALSNNITEVNGKSYSILSLLGSGGSCKVYSAIDLETKSVVAIKHVELPTDTDASIREGFEKEIEYLLKLQNSDRVIKMYDFEYRNNEILLILEHGDIDFAKYISNEAKLKRLSPLMIKFYWAQMLEAVADIHKYGIVHSDLKPANFLLVAGNLKLIDFGIAASVPDDRTSTFRDTQVGTLNYISPEAITQLTTPDEKQPCFKVGVKSDVWSLGCILYNLAYGVTPFSNIKNRVQKIYAITNPKYEIPFKPLSDNLLLDVLKLCLRRNPKERASVEELLKHPYLTDVNAGSISDTPPKPNDDFDNVLKQMQVLTPRRMNYISKVVKQLSANSDA